MELRLLSRSDYASLLRFEVENRAWFESHINPREVSFYSVDGVKNHIEECLAQYQKKPCCRCLSLMGWVKLLAVLI